MSDKVQRSNLFRHPGMRVLFRAVERESMVKLMLCLALFIAGMTLIGISLTSSPLLVLIGFAGVLWSLRLCAFAARELHSEDSRLYYILRHQPRRIVWVYAVETQRMPFGLTFSRNALLYFKMIDGDEISVSVPAGKARLISRTLNRLLPHATFGYSPEKAKAYEKHPETLIRKKAG